MVCLAFEITEFNRWMEWFSDTARALGIDIYRDNEDDAFVDSFFTVDSEARGRELAERIATRPGRHASGVVSTKLVGVFRGA